MGLSYLIEKSKGRNSPSLGVAEEREIWNIKYSACYTETTQ